MHYIEFKNKLKKYPIFLSKDAGRLFKNKQLLLNQLLRWKKKGLIIEMRRGCYIFADSERATPSRLFIAGQLYWPSYVSMEYALALYGLIPEKAVDVTNITTKKPMRFTNALGTFTYQHIKPAAFRGYTARRDDAGMTYFIAEPEKAVIDFLYLNRFKIAPDGVEILETSFRFQHTTGLRLNRLTALSKLFRNKRLNRLTGSFCAFVRKEKSS